ncbi:MAG: McrC family protein [Gemmataceae bacterium]|nr:McrC family protein [Gemmataceae bacterium]
MAPPTQPTFSLTERTSTECPLSPEDVEFLLTAHRGHLDLVPTHQRDLYRLTPRGHVGTIVAPHCRLLIRPKIPLENLFFLLDPADTPPPTPDHTTTTPGSELLDFLAAHLAQLMTDRATHGLHRAYVERDLHGPFVQGRLDLPAQLRDAHGRKDRIHCRHEEFTLDMPCNQVPRATADLVLRSPLLGDTVRAALRRALAPFAEVSPVPLGPDSFALAAADRLTEPYRPLLELCRLLADSLGPSEAAGASPCPAFLLDLERVFERHVTAHCVAAWHGQETVPQQRGDARGRWSVDVQPLFRPHPPVAGQPDVTMRPDLMLTCDGRKALVVDAKWKRLRSLITSDLYQILAYCAVLGVDHGALVYPGRHNRAWEYRFAESPIRLTVHTLRVVGSRASCRAAAQKLARKLGQDIVPE